MTIDLQNRTAIITGGALGIGLAIAKSFATANARIEILDLNEEAMAEAADAIRQAGGDVQTTLCDVSDHTQVDQVIEAIAKRRGAIDIRADGPGLWLTTILAYVPRGRQILQARIF